MLGPTRGVHQTSGIKIAGKPNWQQMLLSTDDETHRVGAATAPIRYQNRTLADVENAALPGRHYVAVNYSIGDKKYLLPYLLVIKVIGTAGEGAPTYVTASPTPGSSAGRATSSPEPSGSASSVSPPSDESGNGNSTMARLAAAAIGGGLVAAAVVGFLLWRRKRS